MTRTPRELAVEALEYYAEPLNYFNVNILNYKAVSNIDIDEGTRAREAFEALRAQKPVEAALQSPVPEGYVLVPREPSEGMLAAGYMQTPIIGAEAVGHDVIKDIYKSMISAAQKGGGDE